MELKTGENDKGRRLDRILRKALPDHPLPLIHRLLRQGKILVDGKPANAQDRIDSGAIIKIPSKNIEKSVSSSLSARKIPADLLPDIIWQDRGLLAVNKPAGIAVHGPKSLDEMLHSFLAEKLPPSLSFRSGPLHRLDKPTSGIVIFSTSIDGARLFTSLMREHKVKKTYLAILEGNIEKEAIWEDSLVRDMEKKKTFISEPDAVNNKTAITKIKPVDVKNGFSFVMAEIATGRTHQIRAQAAAHGHPLAGDRKYGAKSGGGFFLHAWKMRFLDVSLEAPLPERFQDKIKSLALKLRRTGDS